MLRVDWDDCLTGICWRLLDPVEVRWVELAGTLGRGRERDSGSGITERRRGAAGCCGVRDFEPRSMLGGISRRGGLGRFQSSRPSSPLLPLLTVRP